MPTYFRSWKRNLGLFTLLVALAAAIVSSMLSTAPITERILETQVKSTSRYAEYPDVKIDPANIPEQFRHLLPLAIEWSIGDDIELSQYIAAASDEKKREVAAAFAPHFDGLWKWHQACSHLTPQPDELVLFDDAANAANEVWSLLRDRPSGD